ncbi:LOW QUALITY PROTEIN: Pol protein, partial [Phytophthora palmivora]
MDKYDLILGMPWLEKHEPLIDWRGKAMGANRPAASDRALMVAKALYAPEEVLVVTDSNEDVAMSLATGHETKVHCQACGIATTASPNAESRRAVWASTVVVPDGTDQAGNIGPQAAEAAEESAKGVSWVGNIGPQVGNIGPQAGNIGPQAADAAEEDTENASSVDNIVPRMIEETEKTESAACVSSGVTEFHAGRRRPSETPPARPVEEQCHVFDGMSGRQVKAGAVHLEALPEVSALLNLEKLSMKDFLAEVKAGEIAEMVLLKPETSPEDLNAPSVMDEDILERFTKQRATRLGSEILKNPDDPVYPLVKEYSDVGHGAGKSPHSTPTFCVRKPNGKWRLVHAYNKLNNATVPTQTPIPRKDVLLNNMSGCTLYSALDLVDGYYQILMGESDIPLTAASAPSGMLWEWLAMPQGLSNDPATFNRLVTQLFRPLHKSPRLLCQQGRRMRRSREGQGHSGLADSEVTEGPRKWLGLANYLHKYSAGYAELARPLSDLLKKDADWVWERRHQDAFDNIKASLQQAPVLALPDENKSFSV